MMLTPNEHVQGAKYIILKWCGWLPAIHLKSTTQSFRVIIFLQFDSDLLVVV